MGHLQNVRQMPDLATSALADLFAATEAVGQDHSLGADRAYRWQQDEFADRLGDFDVLGVEADGARRVAAAAVEVDRPGTHGLQERDIALGAEKGSLVTVRMH